MMSVVDEKYEGIASEYQYRLIELLDQVLKRYEIDAPKRQEICGEFAFDLGMLYDQGEVTYGGDSYEAILAFSDGEQVYMPTDLFELHEYAFGNASRYFEPNGA